MIYDLGEWQPQIAADTWVAPSAVVIGRVRLETEASVWFGAVLRGDNETITVGARSQIQDGCVLHTDPGFPLTIGDGCTIGHRAVLHGCTIGPNSLVGMGAIVLNGAAIGRNCMIGANALVPENRVIPDNSLVVGTPGKIVRTIDADGEREIARLADLYVRNWRRFSRELRPSSACSADPRAASPTSRPPYIANAGG